MRAGDTCGALLRRPVFLKGRETRIMRRDASRARCSVRKIEIKNYLKFVQTRRLITA